MIRSKYTLFVENYPDGGKHLFFCTITQAMVVVDDIVERYYDGRIMLVSHRVVNKVIICALLGLDDSHFWNIKLDTCGITSFNYDVGRFILTRHNDTSFFMPSQKASLADF